MRIVVGTIVGEEEGIVGVCFAPWGRRMGPGFEEVHCQAVRGDWFEKAYLNVAEDH